ncbi:AAA family ATPase [Streptomyces sp. WMMC1477]|uniref:AAA family ATPase n=1 Tax=Streptomyces sp. WMMC1477 TaxID=3015155 RepID=UPI0022B73051|nr:AAA family ATPase [Streptomyces sp. WMMC1477]MCZ7434763.1 AAA family ATPase [Streptomyces sp. WMMC1477]
MSGVDTVRGIAYQQAQGVLQAVGVLEDPDLGGLRVEGTDDAVDIELLGRDGTLRHAIQVKVRATDYTWGESALLTVLKRWAVLPSAAHASFEFLTDGRLGPSGQRVQQVLTSAAEGDTDALARLLGVGMDDPVYIALGKATIRQDPSNTGALLARAERQVAAMLPSARTDEDLREQATKAVDRLFRALFDFTSNPEPHHREMDRQIIAALLGVPAEQSPAHRWATARASYLEAATHSVVQDAIVPSVADMQVQVPSLSRQHERREGQKTHLGELLSEAGPVLLTGRTGTGKSTAIRLLRQQAAEAGKAVIMVHAESYLPGRLAALAADGLAAVLGEAFPTATGTQALSDNTVTLAVDGASEIAGPMRRALHEELLAPVSSGRGARIVLVGRDVAALRDILPSNVSPATYEMVGLRHEQRVELVEKATAAAGRPESARTVVVALEQTLDDAAANPLLFSMALSLLNDQTAPKSRADLYRAFIEQLAARNGASGISAVRTALGIVFARLLNDGRRYADVYEWHHLLSQAASALHGVGLAADTSALHETARRCGLITALGWDQTVAAMHDSFADYLAGAAHANGAEALPGRLVAGDDQRMLFCAEIGGVNEEAAGLVARDLPFTTVALARYDRRPLGQEAPAEVVALLRYLSSVQEPSVVMSRLRDGRVLAMRPPSAGSGWIDEASGVELTHTCQAAVVDQKAGPLAIATRLWRQELLACLNQRTGSPMRPAKDLTPQEALTQHTEQTATAANQMIDRIAPPGHITRLRAQVGPLGLHAVIGQPRHDALGVHTPVDYQRAIGTSIAEASDGPSLSRGQRGGSTTLEYLLDTPPAVTAAQRVREAIEALTTKSWLVP